MDWKTVPPNQGKLKDFNEKKFANLKDQYKTYDEIKRAFKNHRKLKKVFKKQNRGDWAILTLYPYGPNENLLDELDYQNPPTRPDHNHFIGTDDRGRDVFARLVYGFRISMTFAILLTLVAYIIGISFGAILGYYGGKLDFIGMRFIEIWSSVPFLFMVMIISSIMIPNFILLIFILSLFGWIGMAWYVRAEFLREKADCEQCNGSYLCTQEL